MYRKLILSGLLRHYQSNKRLFILLLLCSTAMIFLVAFHDSFTRQWERMVINLMTAHLQILPKDSPRNKESFYGNKDQSPVFMELIPSLASYLSEHKEIEAFMPIIETRSSVFSLSGELTDISLPLIAVDPAVFSRVLPDRIVLQGDRELAWNSQKDVPVYRPPYFYWEDQAAQDQFRRSDFRYTQGEWEKFKQEVIKRCPLLFQKVASLEPLLEDRLFLETLSQSLEDSDFLQKMPPQSQDDYDFRQDDALKDLEEAQENGLPSSEIKILRKKYFQSLFPQAMIPVKERVTINRSYSLGVAEVKDSGLLEKAVILPIKISAIVQTMPLFLESLFIDARALQHFLELKENECTAVLIRLKEGADLLKVKKDITAWLKSDEQKIVKDSRELGKTFRTIEKAFDVMILLFLALFVLIVIVFVINVVVLCLANRRQEIGTGIALGLTPLQSSVIFLAEMLAIATVSWLGSVVFGGILLILFRNIEVPGMFIFPGGILNVSFSFWHFFVTLLILLFSTFLACLFPLNSLNKAAVVNFLKDAST